MLAKRGGYAVQRQYRAKGEQPLSEARKGRKTATQQSVRQPGGTKPELSVFFDLPIGY